MMSGTFSIIKQQELCSLWEHSRFTVNKGLKATTTGRLFMLMAGREIVFCTDVEFFSIKFV